MNHLPANHILNMMDNGMKEQAVLEAAKLVACYIPKAASFAVYSRNTDMEALNLALYTIFTKEEIYLPHVKQVGQVIWPKNPAFL